MAIPAAISEEQRLAGPDTPLGSRFLEVDLLLGGGDIPKWPNLIPAITAATAVGRGDWLCCRFLEIEVDLFPPGVGDLWSER